MAGPRYLTSYKQLAAASVPGVRVDFATYNSAKLQTQRAAFLIKEFLVNNLAQSAYEPAGAPPAKLASPWTVYWTSDGTTGPTTDGDTTDRITDHTKFATRADSDTSAISFYVLKSGTRVRPLWVASTAYAQSDVVSNNGGLYVCEVGGVSAGSGGPTATTYALITDNTVTWRYIGPGDGYLYLCVSFRTGQDYYLSISFSTKYARNATNSNRQPYGATGAAAAFAGGIHQTWIMGSDGSGDRILHISANDDGTGFRIAAIRAAAIPTAGGCVVVGRIPDECPDGLKGTPMLALPVFLWTATSAALTSNNGSGSTSTINGYATTSAMGVVLIHVRGNDTTLWQSYSGNCALAIPYAFGGTTVQPVYSADGFLTRKKWPLGYRFQSMPMTHIVSTNNDSGGLIYGTVQDMHVGAPRDQDTAISVGLLFGLRWWCYGMLLMPNPSQLEPTHT